MDNLIYSASPLSAFSGGILTIGFLLLLGVVGTFWAIFNRKEKPIARGAMGCASIFLLLAGAGMVVVMMMQWQGGAKSAIVRVEEKKVVESNCNDGGTCTSYLLETVAGMKYYDFTVPKKAFDKVETDACYQFTYYPAQSLLGEYLEEQDYSDSYEAASTITRIEKVNCQ
jgi:hypothetical protein